MTNVTKLPTASASYFSVIATGRFFYVVLVTPVAGAKPLTTKICGFDDRASALAYGAKAAACAKRPFRPKGGSA